MKRLIVFSSLLLAPSAIANAAELTADVPKDDTAFIAKALSGAPADIGNGATIVRIGDGFKLTPVKTGSNGWTCTIDPDGSPFCTDAAGLEWYAAIATKAEPPDRTGFIYMMAGTLEIWLDELECHTLREGDSFWFESTVGHRWYNPSNEEAVLIWINTPPTF